MTNILNWRTAFAAMMIGSVALFEDPHHHRIALFVTGLSACLLVALSFFSAPKIDRNLVSAGLLLFMLSLAISLPVAMRNGTSLFDWALRGAAPLAFLGAFFFLPIRREDDTIFVERALLAAAMVWGGLAIGELFGTFPLISTLRWTYLSGQLILPINIAGFALVLFGPRVFPDPLRYALLLVLSVLTLGAAYRSQEIIVAGFLVAFCTLSATGHIARRHAIATATTLAASAIVMVAINAIIPTASNDRIFEIGGRRIELLLPRDRPPSPGIQLAFWKQSDTGRLLETQFAFAKFLESPIFGVGLGYPVPSSLIFHGKEQELAHLEAVTGKKYPYVFNVHNFIANVAMTMGLVGLLAIAMVGIGSALALWRGWREPSRVAAFAGLSGLVAFSLVEQSYSLPQFNLMIAALAAVLARPENTEPE